MSKETIEKTFAVSGQARLDLSNIRGKVDLRPGKEGSIQVVADKDTNSGDAKRTDIELIQEADGTVKVKTNFPDGSWSWLFGSHPCKVDYTVLAPQRCALNVNGVSNDLHVEGFEGELSFKSVSGEMSLGNLSGPVKVNTVSGELGIENLAGDLYLHTVSGNFKGKRVSGSIQMDSVSGKVELGDSRLDSVQATTISGEIQLETPLGKGPYNFKSVSGEIKLSVPAETHCSVEFHSISGNFSTELPSSASRHNGTQNVEVQGGGVKVYLNSVSGGIRIEHK